MSKGWYGFDLDGTLAEYDHWRGASHIGKPIQKMVELVQRLLADGEEVRILTARVYLPLTTELYAQSPDSPSGYYAAEKTRQRKRSMKCSSQSKLFRGFA